jgi:NAD(P)-dependent dehydrogenase (short-subunit alcohol dehydrogenase family)
MTRHVKELFDLSGRVGVVTGGSRGLGKEMAEGLAEAGASLMLCARREEWLRPTVEEFRGRGFKVEGMLCDVVKEEQVESVVARTVEAFGQVDILVNNFLFARAAGREMLKRGYGRIINVSSVSGLQSSPDGPHYVGYAASKAGLFGLTRELAATWGRQGIRVNAIAPGFFHSRLADAVIERAEASIKARSPIPRVGDAGELKGVALFLASDASNYITGQTIVVDGGRTIV